MSPACVEHIIVLSGQQLLTCTTVALKGRDALAQHPLLLPHDTPPVQSPLVTLALKLAGFAAAQNSSTVEGPALGFILGSKLVEGSALGEADGSSDGSSDGERLGTSLGEADGSSDGSSLGEADGNNDGSSDGTIDGICDKDGVSDGDSEGLSRQVPVGASFVQTIMFPLEGDDAAQKQPPIGIAIGSYPQQSVLLVHDSPSNDLLAARQDSRRMTVGNSDGADVGVNDGKRDGAALGVALGIIDGLDEGPLEGPIDGEGDPVGAPLGAANGVDDGASEMDGAPVEAGLLVGTGVDGDDEGASVVGPWVVGCAVGPGVGAGVGGIGCSQLLHLAFISLQ